MGEERLQLLSIVEGDDCRVNALANILTCGHEVGPGPVFGCVIREFKVEPSKVRMGVHPVKDSLIVTLSLLPETLRKFIADRQSWSFETSSDMLLGASRSPDGVHPPAFRRNQPESWISP